MSEPLIQMSWKIFFLQSIFLVFFAYLAALHFSSPQEKGLSFAVQHTNERLTQLEQRLAQIKKLAPQVPVQEPEPMQQEKCSTLKTQLELVIERLEHLEKQEKQLWQATADLIRRQNVLVRAQRQADGETESVRVRDWMSTLDAEKREEVQASYRDEMEEMQNTLSASPDAPPPSPETMFRLLQESRERLKLKLKDILTEKEYQAFLKSLEEADKNLPLPPH